MQANNPSRLEHDLAVLQSERRGTVDNMYADSLTLIPRPSLQLDDKIQGGSYHIERLSVVSVLLVASWCQDADQEEFLWLLFAGEMG